MIPFLLGLINLYKPQGYRVEKMVYAYKRAFLTCVSITCYSLLDIYCGFLKDEMMANSQNFDYEDSGYEDGGSEDNNLDRTREILSLAACRDLVEKGMYGEAKAGLANLLHIYRTGEIETKVLQSTLMLYADTQRQTGHFDEAYSNYCSLIKAEPELEERLLRPIFHCLSHFDRPRFDPVFKSYLIHFIEADYTDTDVISGLIKQVLKRDLHIDEQDYEIEFQDIASNALLLAALPHLFLSDPGLEIFFNQLRFHLLSVLLDQGTVDLPLTIAMALRAHNNEYVNYVTPIEDELTRGLFDAIEAFGQASGNLEEIESELIVLAMYLPLDDFPPALLKLNVWPLLFAGLPFADLVRAMVIFPREEAEFEKSLLSIAPISNPVSQLVQGQYESHPYPRWHSTHIRPAAFSYLDAYDHLKPLLENKDICEGVLSCLVAGCGTGKHPITLAKNFTKVDVVALDLSKTSLAYAIRLAEQFQVHNIEFIHGDILDVRKIEKQFDVIECVGVLHHMEDPELGLSSLLAVLKPGGLLNIGLYSTFARREIKQLREANMKIGMAPTIENIREFRFELLNQGRSSFLKSKDFYATSSCRDLLFHEQECQFSLPELTALLEKLNLRFLGFHSLDEKYLAGYRSIYPEDSFLTNLDNWHQFESKYPDTFAQMYQFHCLKAS